MNAKFIIGGVIIVVFLVWGAMAFMDTTVQYVSIPQAKESSRTVQVMGKIDFEHVNYNKESSRLEFAIYDAEAESPVDAERLDVIYYGTVPGNFDQASSVVVKGQRSEDGAFVANQILVKCPSKYQGEGGDDYQNIEKHNEAVNNAGV